MNSFRHLTQAAPNVTIQRFLSTSAQIFSDPKSVQNIQSLNAIQLEIANGVFPTLNGLPEVEDVIVTGRANSGKSSLLNAVLGRKNLVETSSKAGKTRRLDFFRVGSNSGKFILVDSPGYGQRGRPEWGKLFDSYLRSRKELRRIYITFSSKHVVNNVDKAMLMHLTRTIISTLFSDGIVSVQNGTSPSLTRIQPVITKADQLLNQTSAPDVVSRFKEDIHNAVKEAIDEEHIAAGNMGISSDILSRMICLPPLVTTIRTNPLFGIKELRENIVEACMSKR
ncbi:hypothetical protein BDP27DRAFT_1430046 [Rhodocollybia butyracea]|uniref:G domain-containing protein n=1 Tax=Rhodocollybia butyracea TaxID=206335 RepID=A0A9P5PBL7_9AGAR|nr:hypothetical protein BDP27DRAFT_1430046 [Rhodocollybia butyracea]